MSQLSPSATEFISAATVSHRQAIYWGEMDAFQHVNNTVYFRYFENVRIKHFEQLGVNKHFKQNTSGPILGNTQCKYLAPLVYPDNIIISSRITEVREKRFTMEYQIFSEKLDKIVANGSGEIVYYDYNLKAACAIPAEIKQVLDKHKV
jgi:acyl-CoA thioester hydrolase